MEGKRPSKGSVTTTWNPLFLWKKPIISGKKLCMCLVFFCFKILPSSSCVLWESGFVLFLSQALIGVAFNSRSWCKMLCREQTQPILIHCLKYAWFYVLWLYTDQITLIDVFFWELLILLTRLFKVASIIIHIWLFGNHSLKILFFFSSIFFNVVKLYYQPNQLFPLKFQVVVLSGPNNLKKKYIIIWYKPKTSNTEHKLSFQRTKHRWYLSEIKNLERYHIIGHKLYH